MKCKLHSTHIIYQSIALEVLILLNIITPFSFFAHLVWFLYDTSHIYIYIYILHIYIYIYVTKNEKIALMVNTTKFAFLILFDTL